MVQKVSLHKLTQKRLNFGKTKKNIVSMKENLNIAFQAEDRRFLLIIVFKVSSSLNLSGKIIFDTKEKFRITIYF